MALKIATRANGETEGEHCPKCSFTYSNFLKLSDHLWSCFRCGTVFVPKKIRNIEAGQIRKQIEIQLKEEQQNKHEKQVQGKGYTITKG